MNKVDLVNTIQLADVLGALHRKNPVVVQQWLQTKTEEEVSLLWRYAMPPRETLDDLEFP